MPLQTGKLARYTGVGDRLSNMVFGDHSHPQSLVPLFPAISALDGVVEGIWGCGNYSSTDWTVTGENSGAVAMAAGGLTLTTGNANGNATNIQALRAPTLVAGKKVLAVTRMIIADNTNTGWVFGLHVTDADYWSTEPTHQAVFFKDKGAASNAVVGRTKDGTTGSNVTGFNAVDGTVYDLSILLNPGTDVTFAYRAPATSKAWTLLTRKTTNLPAAGQVLRLTHSIENNTSGSGETYIAPSWGCFWEV